jgi:hypothetical protein
VGGSAGAPRARSHLEGGEDVRHRFEAVGTSQPVKFDAAGKWFLIAVLENWMNELGWQDLPEGIFELRNALTDDRDRGELESAG